MDRQRPGRPQKPIDIRNGAVADFAEELRRLRKRADLTVQELAQRAHCSTGAVSSAASGRTLPSWQITRAYLAGCGEDPAEWQQRWEAAAAEAGVSPAPVRSAAGDSDSRDIGPDQRSQTGSELTGAPPLASVATPQDFHLALLALRAQRGGPSLRELCAQARDAGYALARSTLADALSRASRLPAMEVVEALLAACEVPAPERDGWRWAWSKTAYLQQRQSLPGTGRWQDRCPYPGLVAFDEDGADVFYGRDQMTAQLVSRLNGVLAGTSMLAVIGPSGAGKSSLLRAGLLPAAARSGLAVPGSNAWPRLIMTPGSKPLKTLSGHLGGMTQTSGDVLLGQLREDPGQARAIAAAVAEEAVPAEEHGAKSSRLLLIVDQFEELFALGDRAARQEFIAALVSMASPGGPPAQSAPAVVVLGLRSDFFHVCAEYPSLTAVLERPFLVGPMTEEELRIAITAPAAMAGLHVEDGLTDVILEDLRSSGEKEGYAAGRLPLLAHALRQTWERREGNFLTCRAYASAGGLAAGLAASADAAYENLTGPQQAAARTVLLRMVGISPDGFPNVRRRVPLEDLYQLGGAREALQALAAIRLVTIDQDAAEFAHEALIHGWPRLTRWIDEDRARLLMVQDVTEAAYAWDRQGRDSAFLYRGSRLEAVRLGFQDTAELSAMAHHFLLASARQENRRSRLRRTVIAMLGAVVLLAAFAGAGAVYQRNQAQYQEAQAQQALNLYKQAQAKLLDLQPVDVTLTVDSQGLLDGSPEAIASVRKEIASMPLLANRHAGLVLAFVAASDGNPTQALAMASKVDHALAGLAGTFGNARYQDFFSVGSSPDVVRLTIYLFNS